MESLSSPLFVLILTAALSANFVSAANSSDVIINEIAWMGTETSANDEWIELYNNTPQAIDLNGWTLKAVDGTPTIKLAGSFPANSFNLLERSKNYTGALNNKGEKLELFDNKGNLIDSVDCLSGWPAGDNTTKQTMERKDAHAWPASNASRSDAGWQTSQNPGGTPKAENSPGQILAKSDALKTEPQKIAVQPLSDNKLAAVSEPIQYAQDQQTHGSLFPALTALAIAIFSSIIILVLKNKVKIG